MPPVETDDPIHEDGTEGEQTPSITPEKSARELAIEAIAEANLRRLEADSQVKLTGEERTSPEQEQLAAQLADEVIADPGTRKVRIKIDGVETEVALSDVVRSYQVGNAADKRMQEASRLLAEAKAQVQQQRAPAPTQETDPAPEPVTVQTPVAVESRVKEAFDKLFEGDSDAAVKAMAQLISEARGGETPTPAPISIDAIAEQLQQRLAVDTAFATIQRDYPDVIANKDIELLTAIKVNQKIAEGASRADAMLESAKEVYVTLGKVATGGRQQESRSESRGEKLTRKAGMDHISAANLSAAPSDDAALNVDVSSVIQEIANRRMGQSLMAARR